MLVPSRLVASRLTSPRANDKRREIARLRTSGTWVLAPPVSVISCDFDRVEAWPRLLKHFATLPSYFRPHPKFRSFRTSIFRVNSRLPHPPRLLPIRPTVTSPTLRFFITSHTHLIVIQTCLKAVSVWSCADESLQRLHFPIRSCLRFVLTTVLASRQDSRKESHDLLKSRLELRIISTFAVCLIIATSLCQFSFAAVTLLLEY